MTWNFQGRRASELYGMLLDAGEKRETVLLVKQRIPCSWTLYSRLKENVSVALSHKQSTCFVHPYSPCVAEVLCICNQITLKSSFHPIEKCKWSIFYFEVELRVQHHLENWPSSHHRTISTHLKHTFFTSCIILELWKGI